MSYQGLGNSGNLAWILALRHLGPFKPFSKQDSAGGASHDGCDPAAGG